MFCSATADKDTTGGFRAADAPPLQLKPGDQLASESWQIVLVAPGRNITSELLPIVSSEVPSAQVIKLQEYPLDGKLGAVGHSGVICFLDLITNETEGLRALAKIVAVMPSVPVVSLIRDSNPNLILQALRLGGKDFLTQPFNNEQFRTVMEKLVQLSPELVAQQGRVISIIPAKGACGASTIALNLAAQLKNSRLPSFWLSGQAEPLSPG